MSRTNGNQKLRNKMKFITVLLLLVTIVAAQAEGMRFVAAATKKPKLNYKTVSLCRYHSCTLKVKNTKKAVQWQSSDAGIASIAEDGTLTGNTAGVCKVTAKFGKKKLTCQVTVTEYTKEEVMAAYALEAAEQLLGKNGTITLQSSLKSTFMNNMAFSYVEVNYKAQTGETKTAYVYAYEQELPEEGQAYMSTVSYENLIIRVDSHELERMLKDRSKELDVSRVQAARSSVATYESMEVKKSATYEEKHTWIGL